MTHLLPTSPAKAAPNFYGMAHGELSERLESRGLDAYRADQLFSWVYHKHQRNPDRMTNLPATLRGRLGDICDLALPGVASVHTTADGRTHKFALRLSDGAVVECVAMKTPRRLTLCLSSQVGCALKCSFCATGLMGLVRNLSPEEIVSQVIVMGDFHDWSDERFNLVFMGMGEPLANYRAVLRAIQIFHDPRGLNLGMRRVTVSTSGLAPQIRKLGAERLPLGLAVSLHATTDELRDQLVPVNRRWPIHELLDSAREYGRLAGRRVTLEYTLLAGINDGLDDADRLAAMARDLPSKINLIPYNPVPGLPWQRPTPEAVERFAGRLLPQAPAVTVRHTMGKEIWAACGQLGGLSPEP
jgi:23S rRNA (adenine2503-C2)-methyltransferase